MVDPAEGQESGSLLPSDTQGPSQGRTASEEVPASPALSAPPRKVPNPPRILAELGYYSSDREKAEEALRRLKTKVELMKAEIEKSVQPSSSERRQSRGPTPDFMKTPEAITKLAQAALDCFSVVQSEKDSEVVYVLMDTACNVPLAAVNWKMDTMVKHVKSKTHLAHASALVRNSKCLS